MPKVSSNKEKRPAHSTGSSPYNTRSATHKFKAPLAANITLNWILDAHVQGHPDPQLGSLGYLGFTYEVKQRDIRVMDVLKTIQETVRQRLHVSECPLLSFFKVSHHLFHDFCLLCSLCLR